MLKNEYDVIVVGGGPAGTATAKRCAELGLDVALLEKRQEIGTPKRCGEGLASTMMKDMDIKIPDFCIRRIIKGFVVYAPNGESIKVELGERSGCVVERKMFDKWLAFQASRAGAYIQAKTPVTGIIIEDGIVKGVKANFEGDELEIRAKIVVGADGIESKVGRWAGLNTTNKLINIDSGYQYEMSNIKNLDMNKIHLWFGNKIAPRGYAWAFPKGDDVANIGVGVALSDKPARYYLDKFIAENPKMFEKASIIEVNAGGIPVGGFLENMVGDGFAVVGDAAHQVNPIHGGGMREGNIAGKILGEVIADAIKKGDISKKALEPYNKRWWEERGKSLEKVQRLREVMEKLSDDDYNMIAGSGITGEDLMEFSRGNKLGILGKILFKKPGLIKLAKHLL